MDTTYSSAEACHLANITYRQMDWWCRVGRIQAHIPARGSGTRRRWSQQQVMILAVLGRVGGHARITELDELAVVLTDWPATEWDSTTLLIAPDGVWLPDEKASPAVAVAVNLAAVRREVEQRAQSLLAA